ncbi:MFS transporter [Marinicella sediminis]|nr:MFS transporter [Marinicella sediminis]
MNSIEKRSALAIAFMIALRMYGLFLILPVFAIMGQEINGSTPVLLGVAVGVYGLTQAILQIPMGFLSDVWGRKKVITLGLTLFLTGSVIAALASSIEMIILGRLIQGMGAIASTGLALIADVSRPEQRGKMMGIVGSSIGLSFMLAFITGPILANLFGLSGLFWITALLAALALVVLWAFVNEPAKRTRRDYQWSELLFCIKQKQLVFMDLGIFVLHASMTALFLVLPVMLADQFGMPIETHWKVYLPVLLASLLIMVPMIILQEKFKKHHAFMLTSFLLLGLNFLLFTLGISSLLLLALLLVVYFGLFNFLEAAMPALLSKTASEQYRGAAMGVFSSAEFLGAFMGGIGAGWLLSRSMEEVFYALAVLLASMALAGLMILRGRSRG